MRSNLAKGIAAGVGLAGGTTGAYALGRNQGKQTNEKKVSNLRRLYGNQIQRQRIAMHRQNQAVQNLLHSYAKHRKGNQQ